MTQSVMNDYRARKVEEEYFERTSFSRPCELILKHGNLRTSYWGKPEVLGETERETPKGKLTAITVLWKTKRDMPAYITLLLSKGYKLESVMNPCKYMETDKGYSNVISLVISGLVLLNILNTYMTLTMADLGAAAFASPVFIGPFCAVLGVIFATLWFNKTHFTYRLSVECFEPTMELGKGHLCYAVDSVPIHKQLSWVEEIDEVRDLFREHSQAMNEAYLDLRAQVGETNVQMQDILLDRKHADVQSQDRALILSRGTSVLDSKWIMPVLAIVVIAVALVIFLAFGGA